MLDQLISIISYIKASLPSLLFILFLCLGFIIWKLYSELKKQEENNNFVFQEPFMNNTKDEFRQEIKKEIKEVIEEEIKKEIKEVREEETKKERKIDKLGINKINKLDISNSLNSEIKEINDLKPERVDILRKMQNTKPEQDFDGYIALQDGIKLPEIQEKVQEDLSLIFFPLLEIKGLSIPRFKQVNALKQALEINEVLFLIGHSSIGKSYLVSLLSREIKYSEACLVLSFTFSQQISDLNTAIKLILLEQLKLNKENIGNPIQTFFKVVSQKAFLILFNNIEFLSNTDLMILYNCNLGLSKAVLISSSLSAKALYQNTNLVKRSIIELQEIEPEIVQSFFLERVPQAFNINPLTINKLIRFIKGYPLILVLLCSYLEKEFKNNGQVQIDSIFKQLENTRVNTDKALPINLHKLLYIMFSSLSQTEKDILLFCSYLPLNSFSTSIIEYVFDLPLNQGIQILDNLNQIGFVQRLSSEVFQNPHFKIHSIIKEYIYKEHKPENNIIDQLVNKIILYFTDILEDDKKLERENKISIVTGLLYVLKVLNNTQSNSSIYSNIYEKSLNYLARLGLFEQIETAIIPIFSDNLNNSSNTNTRAVFERLLGLSLILLSNNRNFTTGKTELIEQGIIHLNNSLNLYISSFSSINIRKLYNNLGNAYLLLSESIETEENLIKAIDNFKKAIQLQVQATDAKTYIEAHINLGNSYLGLYKIKASAVTVKLAIQIFTKVLNTFSTELNQNIKSILQQSLANALRNLSVHEDPISNLQAAIHQYKASLEGTNQRAVIYNSLGCCYWKLAKYHTPLQNIEFAISSYKKSLEFLSQGHNPFAHIQYTIEYAVTHNNLGTAYKTLAALKNPENNLDLALKAFREALSVSEKCDDRSLIKVINQHLFELSNLADSLMRQKPEYKESLYNFKSTLSSGKQ